MVLDIYNGQIQGDLDITSNLIVGGIMPLSTIWTPPSVTNADIFLSTTVGRNTGCGYYYEYDSTSDDEVCWNISLKNKGLDYDGSSLQIKLYGTINLAPNVGNTLILDVFYAFISLTNNATTKVTTFSDTIILTSQATSSVFVITLSNLTGSVGAKYLQFCLARNSTGGGADSYSGNYRFYAMDIIKI